MENITSKMDSVFDSASDIVSDFDVMFDEDDHLVDVVEGFASNGKPLTGDEFEDIHLSDDEKGDLDSTSDLDDDCDPKDIKDALTGDELMGSSIKDIENGEEWDIDDNDKYFKSEEKDAAEKWFEDSDKEYQKSNFKGSVDPENINAALAAQRESAAMNFLENDTEEDDKKEELEAESALSFLEDTVHDDIDSTTDIMGKKPKDEFDIEDEDDPKERKDDTETDDGVGKLKEAMDFLECGEGMLADNDEADVHSEVQCDGSANCKCPACRSKEFSFDSELAVGDTFQEEVEEPVEKVEEADELGEEEKPNNEAADVTEPAPFKEAMSFLESDEEVVGPVEDVEDNIVDVADDDDDDTADINLDYDTSDEDLIDLALGDDY